MVWVNILHIGDIDTLTRSLIVLFSQKKSLHGTLKDIPVRYLGPLPARSPGDSVAWPDSASSAADDPSPSTLEAFDGLSPNSGHAKTINVWVQEPERRGISAMQFERFFNRFCGDVIYEDLEEPKPLCLPTTLCQACVQANRADPEVKNRSKRPRETNLYAVTELIIKPETAMLGVSYSELINPDGLQVDYFISHHWAEDFGEFVQSVLRHAIVAAPEMGGLMEWTAVVYWCCAFANNQHQVELGETLQKSPFYQALNSKNCRGTVMNLNQAATALDRIWCIYEVYLAHTLDKPFTLNFKLGPLVGVVQETKEKDSWVFHIFKMLQHIDVQQADATSPDDYRKIMGEIANFQSRDGRSGPQALNRVVKAMLGSQAIFTLARRGDMGAVRRALELDADPNIPDTLGIRPLTYAAGNGHEEVVQTLIAGKANADAQKGANEVLAMFSPNRAERRRCIDFVRALDEAETGGVHSQAISRALLQHTTSRCQDLTSALDADNAELRLEVVRELRSLLHALVDHRNKLMRDQEEDQAARDPDDPASGEDERVAIGRHAKSLAPYMADPDPRVRIAVVEAVTSIKAFDLSCLKVPKRMIQEDDLHIVINSSEKLNVVHLAAMQPYPNALYMLATGVDWALDPKALRALDGLGRNIAHLAVRSGHLECLAMMVGELKLPRSSLMLKDSEGRTPVHYAALNGDSGSRSCDGPNSPLDWRTSPDNTGSHAAHLATARKYWRFLGVLVNDCGISVDALCLRDTEGRNVAHLAAANGDSQTLRYLAEKCRLPHSALEQADHWFRTPAHHAALADSAEVLALLQELGAPLHLPMGPLEPQIGAVAIVNQSNEVVWVDRHQKMRFEYEKGIKDTEGVEADRCDLAPTPLVLAEKFGRKEASEFLSNAWTPIVAEVSGQIQKEELMLQARAVEWLSALGIVTLRAESPPDPLQPEVTRGQKQLQEQRQLAVRAVSAMECTSPSFLRAVPAWAVLRNFGQVLRGTNMDANELYSMSFQVDFIDEFWSHSWHSIVFLKVWLLLMLKNGRAACVGGTLVATLVAYLSYADVLPGWYKEPRLQGPGYSGEFRFSPWANLSGCATALLLLLFWQSSSKVFVDRTCIHQGDGRLKAEGIINLGALLKKSRTLVVVWDPSYLSRLWCVFELAAFLHGHRDDPSSLLKKHLVIKPSVLVPLTFLVGANAALTLLFEITLPDTDAVAFMRIFLGVGSQVPLIYIIQRLWQKVMDAERQFRTFSLQKVRCYCCSVNHLDKSGNSIPCDKEIIEDCIVEWYGSVEDFEVGVRTHVHDAFIEQVTRFPLGYQWTVGMTTCILWGQLDAIAARAHGGRGALPSGVLVSHGAYASVEKFLQKGLLDVKELAKRDAGGCSCLHRAARTGVAEAVYSILHVGQFTEEDMKAADKQGWSVVHHAAAAGNAACLEVILQLCQLPHSFLVTPDNWGRTPAHVAAEFD
ncbi:ANKRD52, partial [Symbiodinium sp. KB8]